MRKHSEYLADNLRKLRNGKLFSQRHTADLFGIGIKAYQAYEAGRNEPSIPLNTKRRNEQSLQYIS